MRGKPSGGYFGRSIKNERLSDGTKELPDNHVLKRVVDQTSDACADRSEYRASDDPLFNSLYVKDPVGREVQEDVTNQVTHGNQGHNSRGLVVGLTDFFGDGGNDHPAHAVGEIDKAEEQTDNHSVRVLLENGQGLGLMFC